MKIIGNFKKVIESLPYNKIFNCVGMALINGTGGFFAGSLLSLSKTLEAEDFCKRGDESIVTIMSGATSTVALPLIQVLLSSKFDGTARESCFFVLNKERTPNPQINNVTNYKNILKDRLRFSVYAFQPFYAALIGGFMLADKNCELARAHHTFYTVGDINMLTSAVGGLVLNLSAAAVDSTLEFVWNKYDVSDKIGAIEIKIKEAYQNWGG